MSHDSPEIMNGCPINKGVDPLFTETVLKCFEAYIAKAHCPTVPCFLNFCLAQFELRGLVEPKGHLEIKYFPFK
jgi:hypothetical protein